jgi:hypothetical protein
VAGVALFVSLLLAASSPQAPAADLSAVVADGPSQWGTNVWWTDQDADLWTERWAELGPSQVRMSVSHAIVEPENDNADPDLIEWSGFRFETPITVLGVTTYTFTYRAWFEALRDQPDLDVLIHFSYLAPWLTDNDPHPELLFNAAPYPPNDLDEYREFVEAVVRYLVEMVDFPPERLTIEAMNEPDLECGADPVTPCFWRWSEGGPLQHMDDIAGVVRVTHEAIQAVDTRVALVGLAECCGTDVVRELLDHHPEGAYLDGLSYHYYSPSGYDLDEALDRASELAPYGRPVYLDEYGSREYQSEGVEGGLWHSWALVTLWEAGIAPLQYPISEWPLLGEPYNSMGLFEDWRGDWERKPAYWVYANFFGHVAGGEVISATAPPGVDVLATRRATPGGARVALWVVNRIDTTLADQSFAIYNFPEQRALLRAYDNLVGPTAASVATISGAPLVFTATLPARSSQTFVVSRAPRVYLPMVLREDGS